MLEGVAAIGRMCRGLGYGLVDVIKARRWPAYLGVLDFTLPETASIKSAEQGCPASGAAETPAQGGRSSASAPSLRLVLHEIPENTAEHADFARKWGWVGNASGQDANPYLTTTILEYLVAPKAPNKFSPGQLLSLAKTVKPRAQIITVLERLLSECYTDRYPKCGQVLDVAKLRLADEAALQAALDKDGPEGLQRAIVAAVKGLSSGSASVVLWTIAVNGVPLVASEEYWDLVVEQKLGKFSGSSLTGFCSVCGAEKEVSYGKAFTRLDFLKYYIPDKVGFASGVTETGFERNFLICRDCLLDLFLAERYLEQNMQVRIGAGRGAFTFLLIPEFLLTISFTSSALLERLKAFRLGAAYLADFGELVKRLASPDEQSVESVLRDAWEEAIEEERAGVDTGRVAGRASGALLSFVFCVKKRGALKVRLVVKDVVPGHVARFLLQSYRTANRVSRVLNLEVWPYVLDFTRIHGLFPGSQGEGAREVLAVYDAILKSRPIPFHFLVQEFCRAASDSEIGQRLRQSNRDLLDVGRACHFLRANLFLKLLGSLNLLKGVNVLAQQAVVTGREDIDKYTAEMNYTPQQVGLFVLGYLLNRAAGAQYSAGHQAKPILERVNYTGIGFSRVVQLANVLFEKLHQYDVLQYYEGLYAEMKLLLDKYRDDWSLSPEENVFYILSGYSFGVLENISRHKKGEDKGDQQEQ